MPAPDRHFPRRCHVEPIDHARNMLDNRRHGIGLHRIMDVNRPRQIQSELFDPICNKRPVIGIEWGLPDAAGKLLERNTAHRQLTLFFTERVAR